MIAELTVEGGVDEELAKNSAEALPHLGIILQPVWEQLPPGEKADVVRELVEQVAYDGANGKLAITFRPRGIVALAAQERKQ